MMLRAGYTPSRTVGTALINLFPSTIRRWHGPVPEVHTDGRAPSEVRVPILVQSDGESPTSRHAEFL